MAIVPSCVSSSLLLLFLVVTWRASSGVPVSAPSAERCQECSSLFRNLLKNIEELQRSKELCFGITSSRVLVSSKSSTLLACTPMTQNTNCLMKRNSSFNKTKCMKNIMKDLDHYAAAFQSYLKAPLRNPQQEAALLTPTVAMIQSLRKSCFLTEEEEEEEEEEEDSSEEDVAQMWGSDTFSNRQEMCMMMRGFYTRTITINRAVGYISSGEHTE